MPEYLAPGVYVEEVSFRAKSIEGVSTSVAGFIGPTRYGPTGGPPELLTSYADFERIYAGLDPLQFESATYPQQNYMAHAVRAFFDNGGSKLYVTRVYGATDADSEDPDPNTGKAKYEIGSPRNVTLRARFPGHAGEMRVVFAAQVTSKSVVDDPSGPKGTKKISGVGENDTVYVKVIPGASVPANSPGEGLYDVVRQGDDLRISSSSLGEFGLDQLDTSVYRVALFTVNVRVRRPGRFEDEQSWPDLSPNPENRSALISIFTAEPTSRLRYLTVPYEIDTDGAAISGAELAETLLGDQVVFQVSLSLETNVELRRHSPAMSRPTPDQLEATYVLDKAHGGADGSDGKLPNAEAYNGEDSGAEKTGLKTFEDVDEISIVAAPGHSARNGDGSSSRTNEIVQYLITHCQQRMKYRVAVLDAMDGQVVSEVKDFRGQFDSTHAALYYPWITIVDPLDPDGRREIDLPPSGFVVGIYARTDVLHGVFKAPANEVVLGAIGFETLLNKAQQDILNPLGINCFRFFEGRGYRLWGARTISSDPEWKYISVRRYFAYLEHSIDKGTQWAVFENNNEPLWANVRQTVSDFLFNEWRNGALMGTKPEEAFFVRCDRSTMTQNDLDNGRLICLIGVAVVKPAEFVIFRIGQFTADSKM
jgi:phage tail sheath protein FI